MTSQDEDNMFSLSYSSIQYDVSEMVYEISQLYLKSKILS